MQLSIGEDLTELTQEWMELVKKNREIQVACSVTEAGILALQENA